MKKSGRYLVIAVVLAVIGLVIFQLVKQRGNRTVGENAMEDAIPVETATVAEREFRDEISGVGTLTAQKISPLSPKVPGNVAEVLVDIGSRVKSGDVVIKLDDTDYDLAASQSKANFQQAEKAYERAKALLAEKVIPQSRFDAAEAAYVTSRETLALAKERLSNSKIRTPIDGVVVERHVEVGQTIGPGGRVLRIVNQSSLYTDVGLPERDFETISTNTLATITVDAFPKKTFRGRVALINPMVDPQTRTFRVRVEAPNPDGMLVDGMFARVRLLAGKRNSLAIPRDALQRLPGSGTYYVFVVDGSKAEKKTVRTGVVGDEYAEILDDLAIGDEVVTSGTGRLRSGMQVAIPQTEE